MNYGGIDHGLLNVLEYLVLRLMLLVHIHILGLIIHHLVV